jgi:AbrB family looped-hinge helix DNA binding protein
MNEIKTRLGPGGRVVIPAACRKAMGLAVGDELVLRLEDGELRLLTVERAVARAQALVRRYVKEGASLADDLIAERRRDAGRG